MRVYFRGPRILGIRTYVGFNPFKSSAPYNSHKPQNKRRGAFIYVIKAGDHVKVGVSVDPIARLANLQVGNSETLALVYTAAVKGDNMNAYVIEGFAHGFLKNYQLNGEWYKCSSSLAIEAIERGSHNSNVPIVEVAVANVPLVIKVADEETAKENKQKLPLPLRMLAWVGKGVIAITVMYIIIGAIAIIGAILS